MEPKKQHTRTAAEKLIKNLEKRGFDAYYADSKTEALDLVKQLIPAGSSISWGGSMSREEMGIDEYLIKSAEEKNYKLLDRFAAKTDEERRAILAQAFLCDWFIMGINAITTDGILVNTDGSGNRLSFLLHGPKNVLVLAGINKLAADEEAALKRIKYIAAPMNVMRLGKNTPCAKTATCSDCLNDDCICSHTIYTRRSAPKGRLKVLVIGEEVGY